MRIPQIAFCWMLLHASLPSGAVGQAVWRITPDLRIGSSDQGDYAFGKVAGVSVDDRGSIYVLDRLSKSVSVYGRAGRFMMRIGREGSGPGEFQDPVALGHLGDTLWVSDRKLGRVTFFFSRGKIMARTLPLTYRPASRHHGASVPSGFLANGTALVEPAGVGGIGSDFARLRTPLVQMDRGGRVRDTLLVLPFASGFVALGSGSYVAFQPFNDAPLWRADQRGSSVAIALRKASSRSGRATFRIRRLNAEGQLQFEREYSYTPVKVSRRTADSLIVDKAREISPYAKMKALEDELRDGTYLPRYHPPVTDIVPGADGTTWIRREEMFRGATVTWNVLDRGGKMIGVVRVPRDLVVQVVSQNAIWGVQHDELDVPYVVRYRVSRPAAR